VADYPSQVAVPTPEQMARAEEDRETADLDARNMTARQLVALGVRLERDRLAALHTPVATVLTMVRHAAGDVADYLKGGLVKGGLESAAATRLGAVVDGLEQLVDAARAEGAELARLRAMALNHRMRWECLAHDVDLAIAHREQKGGQHAGVPRLASAPPSLLARLRQDAAEALALDGARP